MAIVNYNRNAFDAYQTLYYPLFGDKSPLANIDLASVKATEEDYAMAFTVQENLNGTPYRLSDKSVMILAQTYACLRAFVDESSSKAVSLYEIMIDPSADIREIVPESVSARPMYPDFPTQVLDIDPVQFRIDQMTHYASTYGVEFLTKLLLGADIEVSKGWMPDAYETAKFESDEDLVDAKIVELVVSEDAMFEVISRDISRPTRMSEPAVKLAVEFASNNHREFPPVAFHENMMEIIRLAADGRSWTLRNCLNAFAQHPGDIFKSIMWTIEKNNQKHLSTKQKKGFCRAFKKYEPIAIAQNLADLSRKGMEVANMLSVTRFGNKNIRKAIKLVESKKVISYNARTAALWSEFRTDSTDAKAVELVEHYGKHPGALLRSVVALLANGVAPNIVHTELLKHSDKYSAATLLTLAANCSAEKYALRRDFANRISVNDVAAKERFEKNKQARSILSSWLDEIIANEFSAIETPLAGKKVFLDASGFSLKGSVVLPNEVSNTSGAYPPVGMAYELPDTGVVRFFTFWDDRVHRTDVDTHFKGYDTAGSPVSIGWNSSFRGNGTVFSGDITTSENSAEYLDIDMEVARNSGLDVVVHHQHIFAGRDNWKDIPTCFSGALLVGSTAPDVKLYNSKNILFHDDLTGEGRRMDYALIDVQNRFIRILRGANIPVDRTEFTLGKFIDILLASQQCEKVDNINECDIVLSVGRTASDTIEDKPIVCLIDEKMFIE